MVCQKHHTQPQDLQHELSVFHLPTTHSVHIRGTSILLITMKTATKFGKEAQHNTIWTLTYGTLVCKIEDLIRQCEMEDAKDGVGTAERFQTQHIRRKWVTSFMTHYHKTKQSLPPTTHWIQGWVGPGAHVDTLEKRNISTCVMNQTLVIPQPSYLRRQSTAFTTLLCVNHFYYPTNALNYTKLRG